MAVLTAEMWKNHPEEYFAMRADWLTRTPRLPKHFERHHGSAAMVG